jgi:hypothetical protein
MKEFQSVGQHGDGAGAGELGSSVLVERVRIAPQVQYLGGPGATLTCPLLHVRVGPERLAL